MTEMQIVRLEELEEQWGDLMGELSRLGEEAEYHYDYLQDKSFRYGWERDTEVKKQMGQYADKSEDLKDEIAELEQEILKTRSKNFGF